MLNSFKHLAKKYTLLKSSWSPQQNLFYGFSTYIILGFILLCLPIFQKQSATILDHLFIATSAVSTTGLVTLSIFDTYNILGQFVIMVLIQLGGIGYITDFGLLIKNKAHKLSFTTKVILFGFLILLSSGTAFFYFLEASIVNLPGDARFLSAFFQTMTAMTTVGFNTVDFGLFSQAMMLVCIFIMYVGASPSGTAGGIKITTLTAVFAIIKSQLKGSKHITFLGREIPYERLYTAISAFIFYTSIIVLGTFLITLTNDLKFENILFEVASALGTVGISTGITASIDTFGKIIIILIMFIGRLGVLTFGLALWSRKTKHDNIPFIKEDIAV